MDDSRKKQGIGRDCEGFRNIVKIDKGRGAEKERTAKYVQTRERTD